MGMITDEIIMEEKIEAAKRAVANVKLSFAEIAEIVGLPLAKVEELAHGKTA